jgi:Glycosyl hydrolase family 26
VRRRIKHRGAIILSVIIPGVLLTFAVMGVSHKFGFSAPITIPKASNGPSGTEKTLATNGVNIGVYEPKMTPSLTSVQTFSTTIGHNPDLLLIYSEWHTDFRIGIAWKAYHQGMTLIDQWEPQNQKGVGISLPAIASGKYDTYLENYATSVRDFGHKVIISFGHEMNGTWYSWSKYPPEDFVAAWQHIFKIFKEEDANNVTWMWTVHHAASGLQPFWPGSRYVDIIGIDGYFETPRNTFQKIFGVAIKAVKKFAKYKRIMIAETAVGPGTHHEKADVLGLFRGVQKHHLLGLVWFDKPQNDGKRHQDWQLESPRNIADLKEFKAEVKYYATKHNRASLTSRN